MPPPARPTTTATTGTTTLFGRNRPTTSAAPSALLARGGGKLPAAANHSNRRHDELADMQTTESGMNHMDYMAAGDTDGEEATQGVIERARLEAAKRRKVGNGPGLGNSAAAQHPCVDYSISTAWVALVKSSVCLSGLAKLRLHPDPKETLSVVQGPGHAPHSTS